MHDYNTREIRAAARKIDKIANQLAALKSKNIPKMLQNTKSMKGETISAIQSQLDEMSGMIQSMTKSLNNSAEALFAFARRLDEADAKAKALINTK